jgi:hypothetical protein
MKKKMKIYEQPTVKVVRFMVEGGFADSPWGGGSESGSDGPDIPIGGNESGSDGEDIPLFGQKGF